MNYLVKRIFHNQTTPLKIKIQNVAAQLKST